jgi:hypothetical protein
MKKICASLFGILLLLGSPSAIAAETISVTESSDYTAVVEAVGQVWKGKIPTKISYPAGTSSQKLEFQIQGILPHSVLGNRATGTDVEFEIWSDAGKKIASDTVYSFDWNPVGPNTLVSMYLYESDAIGTHTMIIRTIYELSTTGLLTRYLKSEQRFTISITSAKKPATINLSGGSYETDGVSVSFSALPDASITGYELGIRFLKSSGLDMTKGASYTDFISVGSAQSPKTLILYSDIRKYAAPYISEFSGSAVGFAVRAKNNGMVGDWGGWYYFETKYLLNYEQGIENSKQNRVKRCADVNKFHSDISYLAESYSLKFPLKPEFSAIKSQVPISIDCANAADVSTETLIKSQEERLTALWNELNANIKLADTPPVVSKKVTISCVKGKVIKKVTGTSPKCPAGYKKK